MTGDQPGSPPVPPPVEAAPVPLPGPDPAAPERTARSVYMGMAAKATPAGSDAAEGGTVEIEGVDPADGVDGQPSPVSLVKSRPMLSHPRAGIDDAEIAVEIGAAERPPPPIPVVEPDPKLRYISQALTILAVVALGTLLQLTMLGGLQHARDQAQAFSELRIQLAVGTAPVGPLGDDGQPLPAGTPVAILEIPSVGLNEVVLEGTSSRVTMSGPGHRRDSVLPGQAGIAVIIGRRGGYGGPFHALDRVHVGDTVIATTGQGRHTFVVTALRRVGDPLPGQLARGKGRISITTTDGPTFQPTDALRVEADLISEVQDTPPQVPSRALPDSEAVFAGDTSALLALMLWGPLLLAASAGLVYVRHRAGRWQAWIIGVPVLVLLGLIVVDEVVALLPNIL